MNRSLSLPDIAIVTPSFNRKDYLAEAMDSVLDQGYPRLEYVVVDGGSTDGSVEIIERRAGGLAWWVSERDDGAWEALNKGFAHTSAEVMGWLGSDDVLMPWSLSIIGELFATFPQIEWLTTLFPTECDKGGELVRSYYLDDYGADGFFRGRNLPFAGWPAAGFIQQEATYWRRSLWERAGGYVDESLRLAVDFELWARFHRAGAKLYAAPVPLAAFRRHGNQKSQMEFAAYIDEARDVLRRFGGTPANTGAPSTDPETRVANSEPLLRRLLVRVVPRRLRMLMGRGLERVLGIPNPVSVPLAVLRRNGDQKSQGESAAYIDEVLRRYGGRPQTNTELFLRRLLVRALPRRFQLLIRRALERQLGIPGPRQRLCLVYGGPGRGWRIEGSLEDNRGDSGLRPSAAADRNASV